MEKNKIITILAVAAVIVVACAFASSSVFITIPSSGSVGPSNTVVARSGYIADIQAAVDQVASAGGNVLIPAGDYSDRYSGSRYVTVPGGVNVYGVTQPTGAGTGLGLSAWSTILRMSQIAGDSTTMFHLDPSNGRTCRISGIAFVGFREPSPPFVGYDGITIGGTPSPSMRDFRIDHCYFSDFGYDGVAIGGRYSRGVVDHCEMWNIMKGTTYGNTIHIGYGVGYDAVYGFSGWDADIRDNLGTYGDGIVYVEDCYMDGVRHGVVAYGQSKLVIRHCIFDRMHIQYQSGYTDCHGAYPDSYGGRYIEVYDNVFHFRVDDTVPWKDPDIPKAARMRGGGGVFCDNQVYDMSVAIEIADDDGNAGHPENYVRQFWVWNNTLGPGVTLVDNTNPSNVVLNRDYFLRAPNLANDGFTYQKYPYPHYLTLGP